MYCNEDRYLPIYDDGCDGWDGDLLDVVRPTISGLNGAWYFGPNFVPNNGYYDATRFWADPKYPNPETDPYWILTANGSKVDLTCSHCMETDAYSKGDTAPSCWKSEANSVKFKISVGGENGFMSEEYWLNIDTPRRLVRLPGLDADFGMFNPDGFWSTMNYELYSKCDQRMFDISMNETFTGSGNDWFGNNWGTPEPYNWDSMNGTTFTDSVIFNLPDRTPAPERPGPLQNPPKPLSETKVTWATQEFRSGSNQSGVGVHVQTNQLQLYIDHARHLYIQSPID